MKHIIFDVDGTLWDSTDAVAESWNLAVRKKSDLSFRMTGTLLKSLFGKTMTEIGNAIFPDMEESEKEELLDYCFRFENEYLKDHPGVMYPDVVSGIKKLSESCCLYIVSNCQCGYIEVMLESSGLAPYFKGHLCFGDTQAPKSETIRRLMEQYEIDEAVYVGDTQGDADACRDAGVPFIFAEYGFGDVPDAKQRISSFKDLEEMVL